MPTITQTMNMDTVAAPLGRRWGWLLTLGIVEIIAGGGSIRDGCQEHPQIGLLGEHPSPSSKMPSFADCILFRSAS